MLICSKRYCYKALLMHFKIPLRYKAYNSYYEEEIHLNTILNIFAVNYKCIYAGENTIEAQIGYNSSEGKLYCLIRAAN